MRLRSGELDLLFRKINKGCVIDNHLITGTVVNLYITTYPRDRQVSKLQADEADHVRSRCVVCNMVNAIAAIESKSVIVAITRQRVAANATDGRIIPAVLRSSIVNCLIATSSSAPSEKIMASMLNLKSPISCRI